MQLHELDLPAAWSSSDWEGRLELVDVIQGLDSSQYDRGRGFNEFVVNYQETFYTYNEATGQVDTTYGAVRRYNPRQNQYFKPIVTVRDVWSLSDKATLTTTAYASFGTGGGEALLSTPSDRAPDGTIDLQWTWDNHQTNEWMPNGLNLDENGERKGSNFVRISHNNHRWFGALSNFNTALNDQWTLSAGLDARHYTGSHYRTIGDMFGADYYDAPDDRRDQNADSDTPLRTGDKYYYHDDGQVAWEDHTQLELDKYN